MIPSFFLLSKLFTLIPARRSGRGFGLVELLVSMSIMVLVAAVVLANHDRFNSGALLRSQAYEIALRIREIQTSAVSTEGLTGGDYRRLYGASFTAASPTSINTFSAILDSSGRLTDLQPVGAPTLLDDRFEITCIKALTLTGEEQGACRAAALGMYAVFRRPNYDARFYRHGTNTLFTGINAISGMRIYVGARGSSASRDESNERSITITRAGQITVQ